VPAGSIVKTTIHTTYTTTYYSDGSVSTTYIIYTTIIYPDRSESTIEETFTVDGTNSDYEASLETDSESSSTTTTSTNSVVESN
jgi:hypothetical protein